MFSTEATPSKASPGSGRKAPVTLSKNIRLDAAPLSGVPEFDEANKAQFCCPTPLVDDLTSLREFVRPIFNFVQTENKLGQQKGRQLELRHARRRHTFPGH